MVMGYCVWYACMRFTVEAMAATASGLHWSNIMIMLYDLVLWLLYGYVVAIAMVVASVR